MGFFIWRYLVDVELIPGNYKADGYPVISSMDELLVRCDDPAFIKTYGRRWDIRAPGTYRVVRVEKYEERFL
jgi:hypothetical protein